MERVVQARAFTLSKTFYTDGVAATVTGTPTIALTRSDGTVVTTSAVTGSGVGPFQVTVTAANNTILDTLTATWATVITGQSSTYVDTVEVAGGTLFTVSEIQARLTAGQFTTAQVVEMRTTVEQEIERACGCAFTPRYALETLDGNGGRSIMLRPLVTSVRTASVDGTAFTAGDLAALSIGTTGTVYSASRVWSCGTGNVLVGYEHGFQDTPAGVRQAALILAKTWLTGQRSPIDDRALTFSSNDGGSYSLAVPGRGGSHFGVPEVDSVIDRYSLVTGIA